MSRRLSIVIADDHALFREMLRMTLSRQNEGMDVVAEAQDGEAAIAAVEQHRPELLLLDLNLPKMTTRDLLQRTRAISPPTRVIILTGFADDDSVAMAGRDGAMGYVLKRGPLEPLLDAIRKVSRGEPWADPGLTVTQHRQFLQLTRQGNDGVFDLEQSLSRREVEVIRLVAEGMSNKAIAERLSISEKTVTTHLNHIFEKLGVESRLQAALLYNNQMKGTL